MSGGSQEYQGEPGGGGKKTASFRNGCG